MPVASPLNRQVVVAPLAVVHVLAPGFDVAVYEVMAAPPLVAGAVQLTEALVAALVAKATAPVGTLGTVAGVAGGEAADVGLLPAPLVATTVKVCWNRWSGRSLCRT